MNLPETPEGWAVWDLAQRLGGQLRIAGGMGGASVIGFDMNAALAMGRALGVAGLAVAELLPVIEAAMVRKVNERMAAEGERGEH